MRVLSWDPGIVNLAFCVVDYNSIDDFEILKWNNWDLLRRPKKCDGSMKNGDKCPFKPIYTVKDNAYCKKHCNMKTPEFQYETLLPGHKCDTCGKKATHRTDGVKLCSAHQKKDLKAKQKEWQPVQIKVACKKISTIKIQRILFERLDGMLEKFDNFGIEMILIENQIAKHAPKMKAIASALMDYFLIRMNDGHLKKVKHICFFNPNNKIWVKKGNLVSVPKSEKTYKKNKGNSVNYCRELLQSRNMEKDLAYLEKDKKKDDKADALLQCLYKMTRLMTDKSKKKSTKKNKNGKKDDD